MHLLDFSLCTIIVCTKIVGLEILTHTHTVLSLSVSMACIVILEHSTQQGIEPTLLLR